MSHTSLYLCPLTPSPRPRMHFCVALTPDQRVKMLFSPLDLHIFLFLLKMMTSPFKTKQICCLCSHAYEAALTAALRWQREHFLVLVLTSGLLVGLRAHVLSGGGSRVLAGRTHLSGGTRGHRCELKLRPKVTGAASPNSTPFESCPCSECLI